ncbi:MAG: MFS transporter, partial [Hyphomicrobiales bacterium]|nr:MFS transporter [Hyphomicrobiales bacterium]
MTWVALNYFGTSGLSVVVFLMATSQFGGSIVSGWLSDRFHRPLVTLVSNLISLSAVVSLAILLALGAQTVIWLSIVSCVLFGLLPVFDNASRTLMPYLFSKEELKQQNGLFIVITQTGHFGAPVLFGALLEIHSDAFVTLIAAFFFAGAALSILLLKGVDRSTSADRQRLGDHKLDLKFVLSRRWIVIGITGAVIANLCLLPITNLLVPAKIEQSGYGAFELGMFMAAISLGFALSG